MYFPPAIVQYSSAPTVSCDGQTAMLMSVVPGSVVKCSCISEEVGEYQWYISGEALATELVRDCIIQTFSSKDQGIFQCTVDGALSDNMVELAIVDKYFCKFLQITLFLQSFKYSATLIKVCFFICMIQLFRLKADITVW